MSDAERLADLRSLFLSAPDSAAVRVAALVFGLALLAVVLWLVRRRTLRAEYTPIWSACAVGVALIGVDLDLLRGLTRLIGAWTLSSAVFFLGELFLVGICLNYAVRLSQSGLQIRLLAQELAMLRARIDTLEAPAESAREG